METAMNIEQVTREVMTDILASEYASLETAALMLCLAGNINPVPQSSWSGDVSRLVDEDGNFLPGVDEAIARIIEQHMH